jgi:hypothetical protein
MHAQLIPYPFVVVDRARSKVRAPSTFARAGLSIRAIYLRVEWENRWRLFRANAHCSSSFPGNASARKQQSPNQAVFAYCFTLAKVRTRSNIDLLRSLVFQPRETIEMTLKSRFDKRILMYDTLILMATRLICVQP